MFDFSKLKFPEAPNKLAHNERQKMLASFYNNLAVASAVGTTILPTLNETSRPGLVLVSGFFLTAMFMWAAHYNLNKLQE
jgi:hypothetical protein